MVPALRSVPLHCGVAQAGQPGLAKRGRQPTRSRVGSSRSTQRRAGGSSTPAPHDQFKDGATRRAVLATVAQPRAVFPQEVPAGARRLRAPGCGRRLGSDGRRGGGVLTEFLPPSGARVRCRKGQLSSSVPSGGCRHRRRHSSPHDRLQPSPRCRLWAGSRAVDVVRQRLFRSRRRGRQIMHSTRCWIDLRPRPKVSAKRCRPFTPASTLDR